MARTLWAGLDIGVESTSVCVVDNAGAVLHEAVCATRLKDVDRELRVLRRRRSARVGLESGSALHLARGLLSLGYSVDIYEARQLSKFLRLRRNKTDAGDANGIAHAGRLGAPMVSRVYLKSIDCQSLACRLKTRRQLIRTRIRLRNLIRSQLELFGGQIATRSTAVTFRKDVEEQIKILFRKHPDPIVTELGGLLTFCDALAKRQAEQDKAFEELAFALEPCRRMMAIPGVGPMCALSFYAAIGEPNRFNSSAIVGSYLGLTPRLVESGKTSYSGRISKMGNREARSLLIRAAIRFMQSASENAVLHVWTKRIELRRGKGKSRVALARKLATIMLAMWKTGSEFELKLIKAGELSDEPQADLNLVEIDATTDGDRKVEARSAPELTKMESRQRLRAGLNLVEINGGLTPVGR